MADDDDDAAVEVEVEARLAVTFRILLRLAAETSFLGEMVVSSVAPTIAFKASFKVAVVVVVFFVSAVWLMQGGIAARK